MLTYTLFVHYRQPPRFRFDVVPLLLFYAGSVGDVVRELAANGGVPWPIRGALRGGLKVRAHMYSFFLLSPTSALPF